MPKSLEYRGFVYEPLNREYIDGVGKKSKQVTHDL